MPTLRIVQPPLLHVVWEDAHVDKSPTGIVKARRNGERCIRFHVGWLIKETRTSLHVYSDLTTWASSPLRVTGVEERWVIPKKWILNRYEIRVPKRALQHE